MSVHDIKETEFGVLRLVTIELATSRALFNTEEHVEASTGTALCTANAPSTVLAR
jgi:hypothetical protein